MTTWLTAGDGGRLALDGRDLHAGDAIELLVHGHWVPARVEYDWDGQRYYALVSQQPGDGGTLMVHLRIGTLARWR